MVDLFLELFSPNSCYHPPPSSGLLWGSLDLCSHITTSLMILRLNYYSISLCHWEISVSLLSTKVISKWLKQSWIYDEVLNPCDGVTRTQFSSIKDTVLQSGIKWRTAGILALTSSSSSSEKPSLMQMRRFWVLFGHNPSSVFPRRGMQLKEVEMSCPSFSHL